MPRAARIAPQEFVYHVLTRGNNKQAIFKDAEDFQKYIDILKKYKEKYRFKLYHYVLMTNHVHLVIVRIMGTVLFN
jgi:putative transposase